MGKVVTLLHNPGAGFEKFSSEELQGYLQKAGFTVKIPDEREELTETLKEPGDIVVIGGGDGTVGNVAKHLIGRNIPIGLLPLGTANNIAASLGIKGEPKDIIDGWNLSRRKPFDVGLMKGKDGDQYFIESVGFGMFPRLIRQREQDNKNHPSREAELKDALQHQKEIVGVYNPHFCKIQIDDKETSGNYLLIEVMNIRFAGPNMELSPHTETADGVLDIVLVEEKDRIKFAQFLENSLQGLVQYEGLPVKRAKHISIEWDSIHYHIDDTAKEDKAPIKMDISIIPHGLHFLC
jgi:diacylglycerol kinase family enzyme